MQILLKNFNGETVTYVVKSSELVENFKAQIVEIEGVPAIEQHLFYAGHQLEDELTLSEYGIETASTIHLSLRLLGAADNENLDTAQRRELKEDLKFIVSSIIACLPIYTALAVYCHQNSANDLLMGTMAGIFFVISITLLVGFAYFIVPLIRILNVPLNLFGNW